MPSKPVITITDKIQLEIGTIIQTTFLKTNHKVKIINKRTPAPKNYYVIFYKTHHVICYHWYSS